MSSTELLLFVSLLCLWALVRVVRKFLKNSLIFWGMAILYGASLILIIWEWVIMTSTMTFYGEIVKESYYSLLVLHQIFVLGKIVHDDWKRLNKREFARSRK